LSNEAEYKQPEVCPPTKKLKLVGKIYVEFTISKIQSLVNTNSEHLLKLDFVFKCMKTVQSTEST